MVDQYVKGKLEGWSIVFDQDRKLVESAYIHEDKLHGVYRKFQNDGTEEKGYPEYYINNNEVTEASFRAAASNDNILAKSLNDDGHAWGEEASKAPR